MGAAWHWLVSEGGVYRALVGWVVGGALGATATWLKLRPVVRRAGRLVRAHVTAQRQIVAQQRTISDLLDTSTPGGLTEVVKAVRARPVAVHHTAPQPPRTDHHGGR